MGLWDMMGDMWNRLRWRLVGTAGRFILRCWSKSAFLHIKGKENLDELRAENKPVIVLVWHGRIFLVPYLFRNRGSIPLISPSRDGEIISRIVEGWGYRTLRGSGSHTMVQSWKQLVRSLHEGGEILMVPDGPKGPAGKCKPGSLRLAQTTGAYLIPFTFSATKKIIFKSWDRFLMFVPFHRVVALFGEPFQIDPGLDDQKLARECSRVEKIMNDLDRKAESYLLKEK